MELMGELGAVRALVMVRSVDQSRATIPEE